MTPEERLPELTACVARGDEDGVLRLLLETWDQHRSPAVARAIEALSRRLLWRHPPIFTLQRWLKLAHEVDPRSVTALLAAPWAHEHLRLVRQRLGALESFPPDPRIAAYAKEIEGSIRQKGESAPIMTVEAIERVLARHGPAGGVAEGPDPCEALAAAALRLGPGAYPLEEELLAAVFAAPGEEGPRQVYVDYLLSEGHPIAPFLAEALREPGPMKASDKLRWWCRKLLPGASPEGIEFRRAFPYEALIAPMDLSAWPAWRTLEGVRMYQPPVAWLPPLRELPLLSSIELIVELSESWLVLALPSLLDLRIRTLSLPWRCWSAEWMGGEGHWPALQTLRLIVGLEERVSLDEAALGPIARRLPRVELRLPGEPWLQVQQAWQATRTAAPAIQQITAVHERARTSFVRDESGDFRLLRLCIPGSGFISWLLRSLSAKDVDRIEVECPLAEAASFQRDVRKALEPFGVPFALRAPGGQAP